MKYSITESQAGCIVKGGGCKTFKILVHRMNISFMFGVIDWCKENFEAESFNVLPARYYHKNFKYLSYESSQLIDHYEVTIEIFNDQPENIMAFKLRWG